MNFDMIYIDEDTAMADVMRIQNAVEKLIQAKQSFEELRESARLMQGQTSAAIADKADEMNLRLDALISRLTASESLIKQAVMRYRMSDAAGAARIADIGG